MLAELVALFDREDDKRAVSLLINWFRQMMLHKRIRREDYALLDEAYRSSEEVQTMLTTTLDKYGQKFYEEGREVGREVGRREILLAMADRGYTVAVIADMVGLTEAEVAEIITRRFDAQPGSTDTSAPHTAISQN